LSVTLVHLKITVIQISSNTDASCTLCSEPEEEVSLHKGTLDLPWQDELCCDSPTAHLNVGGDGAHTLERGRSQSGHPHRPRCHFSGSTSASHLQKRHKSSGGTCLDILCRIDENWENLICDLKSGTPPAEALDAGFMAISLQRLHTEMSDGDGENPDNPDNPVVCAAEDSFLCSVALDVTTSFVTVVTVSISNATAPPVLLSIPARPVKPSPPVNLTHTQTIEAQLILSWNEPSQFDSGPLSYEVRYSSNRTHPVWQVVSVSGEPRVSLDLKPRLNYSLQARRSGPAQPPLWSDWSQAHHIYLDTVSYIPEKVVARPGENVTVHCVFNDHSTNASAAVWILNFEHKLPHSQYRPVNQWIRPMHARMYDVLRCTQEWNIPYSQIYVEGAAIDISCETNGDIDAMACSWKNTQWTKPDFVSRWADLPCDVMEERDRAGEEVGEMGQATCQSAWGSGAKSGKERVWTCTIQPLRMNCYKLWLEVPSPLGPIRSKPIYLSPTDHVKPHRPTNVRAVSQTSGSLMVTWDPPHLPVEGLKCQFRYHSPYTVRAQPEWKVQSPTPDRWAEVAVPDMCRVYVVQVRCMHTEGTGYWSDWSESVYSTPQNSRAPEHGPDFWRVLQDDPYRNQTNVTLLFKVSGRSYCVDGFVVQHQTSSGAVTEERIELVTSYSFEWSQESHTVTVEAYNSLGSSTNNINMTLERRPKRHCVRSFRVLVINSTYVSLSWALRDNNTVPVAMVVQWSASRQQHPDRRNSGETWARFPYTDHTVYLRGDFFGSEEYGFYLYPVFADGEGEPVYAIATRGDPAAYMLLMIITFLSIVLFVTLVLSQNQMKKFVWKDVPNPNNCSWAKGLDFRKAETFDHLFRLPEGLPAWPLLLPSENISEAAIVNEADLPALTTALVQAPAVSPAPGVTSAPSETKCKESVGLLDGAPSSASIVDTLTPSGPELGEVEPVSTQTSHPPGTADNSAQSSVTYATVLLSDPERDQQPHRLCYKDGSGSSSSDEGNFSANNSDISGSFPGGLWELDSCRCGEVDDPHRSCSYNSVEEFSETSEQEEDEGVREEKDLHYLGMGYPAEDGESEEESEEDEEEEEREETKIELLKNVVLKIEDCSAESHPLLRPGDSSEPREPLSPSSASGFAPLYMPQFRTAPCTWQLTAKPQDSAPQL
uniref:Leptin receptor n=1 Tax=Myripristis murdjan TaxID=586833 RepID=A0A667ZIW4_9TELE